MRIPTMWFPKRSVRSQKIAISLKFCTIGLAKTKALISAAVPAKMICAFVFTYAKCWFSHDAARLDIMVNFLHEGIMLSENINKLKNKHTHHVPLPQFDKAYQLLVFSICKAQT